MPEELEHKNFTVRTEVFEGPLDLLLTLIEKRKLYISDIALAAVADDYIAYVNNLREFPIDKTAHFIYVASTLLLIKSKSLLPTLTLSEEEEGDIRDLEIRLKLYQRFRDLSAHVRAQFGVRSLFKKERGPEPIPVFSPTKEISIDALAVSIRAVLAHLPKKEFIPQAIVEKVISLEEMIDQLHVRIARNLRMSFKEFSGMGKKDKVEVVVSFLAMLELVKQGALAVEQSGLFDDIHMENQKINTPHYGN